jgi:hypothetical protein
MKKLLSLVLLLSAAAALYAGGGKEKPSEAVPEGPGASVQPAPAVKTPPPPSPPPPSSPYFSGDGGKGISLAVLVPEGKSLAADQAYLPTLVQGVFVSDLAKYSSIRVLDRQNLEKVVKETESGIYKNEEDYLKLGEIANVDHAMTGSITKTSTGYALQIQIVPTAGENAATKASYSATCTVAELDNFSAVKKASAELLAQMGVSLTDQARQELSGADSRQAVDAQTALARGITAQKGGTMVESLSYYVQSVNYDPSLAEAASRLNILSADISSGNMGEDVRNDIQWRNQWVERLRECERYYANYMKDPTPYYLVYSTDLQHGAIDYANETVPISFTIDLLPNAAWIDTAGKVVNLIGSGLQATGRIKAWDLNWTSTSISKPSPFINRDEQFTVAVELVNDTGTAIGKGTITLQGGWETRDARPFLYYLSDSPWLSIQPNMKGPQRIEFPRVNANLITDTLTIKITGINGMNPETAAKTKRITILTEAEYSRLPEVMAGIDSRSIKKNFGQDKWGRLTRYEGTSKDVVIPSSLFGVPVTAIGHEAFIGKQLTSVIIPNSVIEIISKTFDGNPSISITLPANVNMRGDSYNKYDLGTFYNKNGKKAGTYTRPIESLAWTYRP